MSGDRYPSVTTERLLTAYANGATLAQLAAETGMHPFSVRQRIARAGGTLRKRGEHNKPHMTLEEKFAASVDVRSDSECWLWTGPKTKGGYGTISSGPFRSTAQRYAVLRRGLTIPEGHEVDHLCFNPSCVNPAHLEIVTADENKRRRRTGPRSHCFRGHELTTENTLTEGGARRCRICRNTQRARRREITGEE